MVPACPRLFSRVCTFTGLKVVCMCSWLTRSGVACREIMRAHDEMVAATHAAVNNPHVHPKLKKAMQYSHNGMTDDQRRAMLALLVGCKEQESKAN